MSGGAQNDPLDLGLQVTEVQTRIFLKLVFDIWEVLERHNQLSPGTDPPGADLHSQTSGRLSWPGRIL